MLLEMLINIIAPHECIGCCAEGSLLCNLCQAQIVVSDGCSRCASPCALKCPGADTEGINHLFVATVYEDLAKVLVRRLKFDRAPVAAEHIARILEELVMMGVHDILVPIRTSPLRYRQRGYDQTVLIAKSVCRATNTQLCDVLLRTGSVRQLGAKRSQRLVQQRGLYWVRKPEVVRGRKVLLLDDVRTTGATLQSAAHTLLAAGAKSVNGLVFAQA